MFWLKYFSKSWKQRAIRKINPVQKTILRKQHKIHKICKRYREDQISRQD